MEFVSRLRGFLFGIALCGLTGGAILAHHSYVTKYDPKRLVTMRGVVGLVDYYNPHIFFDFVTTSKDGATTTWRVETESIPKAQARGLTRKLLKEGAQATITGWRSRDKMANIGLKTIKFKGGKFVKMRRTAR